MLSARTVSEAVASARPVLSEYYGVSDHVAHLQKLTIEGHHLVLGTFNILRPSNVPAINYQPMYGQPLPAWLGRPEDGQGLEKCPFANPYLQAHRVGAIVNQILSLFQTSQRVVLCLQECESTVSRQLEVEGEEVLKLFYDEERRCATLCSKSLDVLNNWTTVESAVELALYSNDDSNPVSVTIYNVHFRFTTASTKTRLCQILADPSNSADHTLVVGDFNVPVMPQSPQTRGQCQANLVQLSDWMREKCADLKPFFALHSQRWTNWAPRKNCADPQQSWDHMDNIMYLAFGGQIAPSAVPLKWCVEMY
jgi:hypothetical protein